MHRSSPLSLGAGPFLCFLTRGGAGSEEISFVEEVVLFWLVVGEISVVEAVVVEEFGLNVWVGAL